VFDQDEVFIRKGEAARRLGVTVRTLERWTKAGCFPKLVQLGPLAVAYRATDLLKFAESRQFVESRRTNPAPPEDACI
jgi:predicted DNA-binding transcriptional regulator AlpA